MVTGDRPGRIDALTGVRMLPAGAVFLSHAGAPPSAGRTGETFADAGYNGVTLFFVLSGFVLTWNYASRLVPLTQSGAWAYAVARIARIYPLYIFALLWVSMPLMISGQVGRSIWLHILAVQAWSPNLATAYSFNGPGWSIGVEIFLYACLPLLLVALHGVRDRPGILLSLAAAVLVMAATLAWWFTVTGRADLPWTDPESAHRWLYRMPLTRLGDFILGIISATLILAKGPRRRTGSLAQALGLLTLVALMAWPALLFSAWSWDAAYMLPAALLLWGLAANPRSALALLLARPVVVLMGEASFAFYLLHQPLLVRLKVEGVVSSSDWLLSTALQFTIISMVAVGAHILVERPAQTLIRGAFARIAVRARAPLPPNLTLKT